MFGHKLTVVLAKSDRLSDLNAAAERRANPNDPPLPPEEAWAQKWTDGVRSGFVIDTSKLPEGSRFILVHVEGI